MRAVSLVPSWTETLLEAGVEVVGRTRFCIHPKARVKDIPRIGGTKDWNWPALQQLKPDLLILDQEENPKWMAEQSEIPYVSTHVTSRYDLPGALAQLSRSLGCEALAEMGQQAARLQVRPSMPRWTVGASLPGLIDWGRAPDGPIRQVLYLIWRDPWMAVSRHTFIGSMLEAVGLGAYLPDFGGEKYPRLQLEDFNPADTLLLFSSEPYPFVRRRAELADLPFAHGFVDGECFSWFGVRSLRFLERCHLTAK